MKKIVLTVIGILIISYIFYIQDFAFAADTNEYTKNLAGTMNELVKVLSRIWIPIANLAGKLMTNTLVSGEVFGISKFLFQAWNISRVITNFIIVGVVLTIVYDIATSGKTDKLGDKILSIILTVVAINASWFLVGAAVDMGTVAVLGVSNMGTAIVSSIPNVAANVQRQMVCAPKEIIIDFQTVSEGEKTPDCINGVTDPQVTMESILPTTDDMSGPFRYFGVGVFRIFDFLSTNGNSNDLKAISISLVVKLFLLLMFLAPLVALLVVNLARVFLIWMRFLAAPFIALKRGLSGLGISRLDPIFKGGGSGDYFDVPSIFGAIFAPATITAVMFLAIITISSLFGSLSKSDQTVDINGNYTAIQSSAIDFQDKLNDQYGISIDGQTIAIPGAGKMTFEGDIIQDGSKYIMGSFGYLIICMMTMGLMRAIFRVGLSTSTLLSKIGKVVVDGAKRVVTQTLVQLPIGLGGKNISLDQLNMNFGIDKITDMMRKNYIEPEQSTQQQRVAVAKQKALRAIGIDTDLDRSGGVSFSGKEFSKGEVGFVSNTKDYFKSMMEDINKKGAAVNYENYQFRNSIQGRVDKGGLEFMKSVGVIKKPEEFQILDDKGKVTGINYEKLRESREFGGFMSNVLSSKFYNSAIEGKINSVDDFKSFKGEGNSFKKLKKKYSDFGIATK